MRATLDTFPRTQILFTSSLGKLKFSNGLAVGSEGFDGQAVDYAATRFRWKNRPLLQHTR